MSVPYNLEKSTKNWVDYYMHESQFSTFPFSFTKKIDNMHKDMQSLPSDERQFLASTGWV